MSFSTLISFFNEWFLGWLVIIATLLISLACTFATRFAQFRYFTQIWKYAFKPDKKRKKSSGDPTSLQAFLNTLSSNLGNGSLAGVATAIYAGGPGAIFWIVFIGIFLMAVRFAEVYLSGYFGQKTKTTSGLGGPMLYLQKVPGGKILSYTYAVLLFAFGLIAGNAIQANTIGLSLNTTWNIPTHFSAVILFLFVAYIVYGGAQRISQASATIVPIKVFSLFTSSFLVLAFHWKNIVPALQLIIQSAFAPTALFGGAVGFSVQQAMRYGISTNVFATGSGLGTAAVLFGFTESTTPTKDALFSMLSTFISTIVCLLVGLCIVASGVWNSGLTSAALTISSYQTVFSSWGGLIVSFLSVSFGVGVLVSYAYITKETWLYLTNGRYPTIFIYLYCATAFFGTLSQVTSIWNFAYVINAVLLLLNLYGIAWLLPIVKRGIQKFDKNPTHSNDI